MARAPTRPREARDRLCLGAFLAAAGLIPDPFSAELEETARRYFERFPPDVKA